MQGVLEGIRVIEMAGMGPTPFCGMMLADHGADVITIERPVRTRNGDFRRDVLTRSRRTIALDLKQPSAVTVVKRLVASADALIEGFRPGVMERLGLGPAELAAIAPQLVYGRMTGWGQEGPLAKDAGHDINYIALAGVLDACGRKGEAPTLPLNLIGDFGGGGMMLAFGVVAGILRARLTGRGDVIDCAMVDGASLLASMMWSMRAEGRWDGGRGGNLLDGGAHFYDAYETADGGFIAVGAIEPEFYRQFCEGLGVADDPDFARQLDRALWPALKKRVALIIRSQTRDHWTAVFAGRQACVTPVLSLSEAREHPHNRARRVFDDFDGTAQPLPAPRFAAAPGRTPVMPAIYAGDGVAVLRDIGYPDDEISQLVADGVLAQPGE